MKHPPFALLQFYWKRFILVLTRRLWAGFVGRLRQSHRRSVSLWTSKYGRYSSLPQICALIGRQPEPASSVAPSVGLTLTSKYGGEARASLEHFARWLVVYRKIHRPEPASSVGLTLECKYGGEVCLCLPPAFRALIGRRKYTSQSRLRTVGRSHFRLQIWERLSLIHI